MKFGFWNVNRNKSLNNLISEYAISNQIDFLILFEFTGEPVNLLLTLNKRQPLYNYYSPISSDFVTIFTKFSTDFLKDKADEGRISGKELKTPLGEKLNIVFLHFPSKLYFEEDDQDAQAAEVKRFIDELEVSTGHDYTIVLGDFNMNPFQKGMVQTTGLHSTFDRRTAMQEQRVVQGRHYKYFYNPMWSFFGEHGKGMVNGSYYYGSAKPVCYFWNIFDQSLVRPSLLKKSIFTESSLSIVSSIDGLDLLTDNGQPNNGISDHLPVEFELNI